MKPYSALKMQHFPALPSTSLYLADMIRQGEEPCDLVVADAQTDGQGRRGRSFYSPAGTGLYATFCFAAGETPEELTPRVALAVKDAIQEELQLSCGIKWVNDLYRNERKVCGILCQRIGAYCLIGIGVNLFRPDTLPEELDQRFGYLCESADPAVKHALLEALYRCMVTRFSDPREKILGDYREACFHMGREVTVLFDQKEIRGVCRGINEDFSLLVETKAGIQTFSSGFVSLKLKNGH